MIGCVAALAKPERAQPFGNDQPALLIIDGPAGDIEDTVARRIGPQLLIPLKRRAIQYQISTGEGGVITVKNSARDGSTLLITNDAAIAFRQKLTPIARIVSVPYVLVTTKGLTLKSLADIKGGPEVLLLGRQAPRILAGLRLPAFSVRRSAQSPIDDVLRLVASGKKTVAIVPKPLVVASYMLPAIQIHEASDFKLDRPGTAFGFVGLFGPPEMPKGVIESLESATKKATEDSQFKKDMDRLGLVADFAASTDFRKQLEATYSVNQDSCKKKDTCEADNQCPRPCPTS
ncbi:hypothetical protein OOZ63_27790 [Paucibacter sp. PLA-PC-4]|uniref:hypothetical protein n=1 Tax=Paucibacter sp. PLA-PC-4 TaxID=2993655 RepID=UPI00224A6E2E|nr:hypothetical protein [Paucibacter sp. PLA-PC-4]MCX2865628.1 hypothetical protein [Paucibacter sp. PLA-PC-4]